ncbi:sigma-w pathway protein ysdB [Bacillus mangrovi]|uniref:Sigma-w pathway protein ysdB n=1 Tax=Metabacillus mangrovi TaxID=1491830 RepID=A0A7X2S3A5_9BACI|nr:sigma-w pathway protein ysdB [Metabacillus mangrovi]MTH52899.1 sigma-w pathway protein ysdB [Metabacillus mangrovi]
MFVLLIRLVLIALVFFLLFRAVQYLLNPKRKLELAREKRELYFLDDRENVRKNFLLTYKGVLFEGEKYLGTTDQSFEVISIFIWSHNVPSLQGLSVEDFRYLEGLIKEKYPHAKIDWKSPIHEFLKH